MASSTSMRKAAIVAVVPDVRKVLYLPLVLMVAYLVFVYLLTIFGPVVYLEYDKLGVGLYLLAVCAAMSVGYHVGVRRRLPQPSSNRRAPKRVFDYRLFFWMLVLAALAFISTLFHLAGSHANLDVSKVGEAYRDAYKDYVRDSGNYSISFILYTISAAPTFVATIWGLYYFRNIPWTLKVAVIVVVFGTPLILALSRGQQNPVGYLVIYLAAIAFLRTARSGAVLKPRFLIGLAVLALTAIVIFSTFLLSRYTAMGIDALNINSHEGNLIRFDTTHPVFQLFGYDVGLALSVLCEYLGNGLVGLGYCLDAPFTWSHMLGSSYALGVVGERVFGLPFYYYSSYPYMAGLTSGWGESHWYTVFPWFASDFTFPGTVILFGFFAYVYSRAWIESVRFANPYSIMLFCWMTLGVVMMPANNPLMYAPGALLTLGLVTTLYLANRRSYNRVPTPTRATASGASSVRRGGARAR